MEESKLFRKIWRFNACVIALAGILAIFASLSSIYFIYKEVFSNRHHTEIVNIDPQAEIQEKFRLGMIQHINGSQSVMIPLFSDQFFSYKFSGKKATASTRNFLFSNISTQTNHWLLPHNNFLIAKHKLINEDNSYSSDKPIVIIIYYVIKTDTNRDERLTEKDLITLAFSDLKGNNYSEIIQGIDDILGFEIIEKTTLAIIFNRNKQGYIAYIDINTHKVTNEIPLPKI